MSIPRVQPHTQQPDVDPGQIIQATRRILKMMPYLLIEDAERIAIACLVFGVDEQDIHVFVDEARRW